MKIRSKVMAMEDLNRPDFDEVNTLFNRKLGSPHWPQLPLRRWEYVAAVLFSEAHLKPGKCLEAGCGTSCFSQLLAKVGNDVDAFDWGQGGEREGALYRYHNMSMTNIKFPDNTFDYVFAMSSIEHINAGKFAIPNMEFDTGDGKAMEEMVRVCKPGGIIVITTDIAQQYYPPPGLWKSGSHRIYSPESINERLVNPFPVKYWQGVNENFDWSKLVQVDPVGYAYTECIITLRKDDK